MSLPTRMETQSCHCSWKRCFLRACPQLGMVMTLRVSVITLPGDSPAGEPAMKCWCAGTTSMVAVCPQQPGLDEVMPVHGCRGRSSDSVGLISSQPFD